MRTNNKISKLMGLPHEQRLEAFKEMLKGGDLRKVPIDEIVSTSPQLKRWMEFTKTQTYAPDEFLAASGLQLISRVMAKLSYIMFGSTSIYPHLWSGFFRKTTALNLTRKALAGMALPIQWSDHRAEDSSDGEEYGGTLKRVIRSGAGLLVPIVFQL